MVRRGWFNGFYIWRIICISAFILGALPAVEPSHGTSVMAAFIMDADADMKDTSLLGLIVVYSHVMVVMILGFATIFLLKL